MIRIILLLLFCFSLYAAENRWLDIEWEVIPGAKEYEVELFQEEDGETLPRGKFKTETPQWSHTVNPGKYSLRIRSLDKRGVPGEWSEKIPLKVKNFNPVMIRPGLLEKVSEPLVVFEWLPVSGTTQYQLVVRDSKNEPVYNASTTKTNEKVYLKKVGKYSWTVFALADDEGPLPAESWPEKSFRVFERSAGELAVPAVKVKTGKGIFISWNKIPDAQAYEIHFMPPMESGEKNKRIRIKRNSFLLGNDKLKDGVTTITIHASASGHQDSPRTVLKMKKTDSGVSVDEIIQGEAKGLDKPLNQLFWRHQLYFFLGGARYGYKSENTHSDTKLDQDDLTSLALNFEWLYQKSPEHNNHRIDGSYMNLQAGRMRGSQARLGYNYTVPFVTNVKVWSFGGGLSYMKQPAFFGNRFNNEIVSESNDSLGPEAIISMIDPLSLNWHLNANFVYAYHPVFLSGENDKAYSWTRVQLRFLRYSTISHAFFVGAEHQRWSQGWDQNTSTLSGWSLGLGYKYGW